MSSNLKLNGSSLKRSTYTVLMDNNSTNMLKKSLMIVLFVLSTNSLLLYGMYNLEEVNSVLNDVILGIASLMDA